MPTASLHPSVVLLHPQTAGASLVTHKYFRTGTLAPPQLPCPRHSCGTTVAALAFFRAAEATSCRICGASWIACCSTPLEAFSYAVLDYTRCAQLWPGHTHVDSGSVDNMSSGRSIWRGFESITSYQPHAPSTLLRKGISRPPAALATASDDDAFALLHSIKQVSHDMLEFKPEVRSS